MQLAGTCAICAVVFSAALLAGCGAPAENPLGLPSLGAVDATSRPSDRAVTPTSSSGRGLTTTADGVEGGASAELGRLTGSAVDQREIVEAVVRYMDIRVRIANTWQVEAAALSEVATGRAARSARARAAVMADGQRRTVGVYVVNASQVRRTGRVARVTGCMVDRTSEIDMVGQVLVGPPGGRAVTITLQQDSGAWLVSDVPTRAPAFCRAPGASQSASQSTSQSASQAGSSS